MTIEDKSIIKSLFMDNGTVLGLFEYNDNIYALISEECVINNYQKVNIYKVDYINNEYIIDIILITTSEKHIYKYSINRISKMKLITTCERYNP